MSELGCLESRPHKSILVYYENEKVREDYHPFQYPQDDRYGEDNPQQQETSRSFAKVNNSFLKKKICMIMPMIS